MDGLYPKIFKEVCFLVAHKVPIACASIDDYHVSIM